MKNLIKLKGIVETVPTLSHKINEIEFYTFDLKVEDGKKTFILPVIDRNYLTNNQYKQGDFISIDGEIRTRDIKDEEDKKHLIVNVYAQKIDLIENIDEKVFLNKVNLSGNICNKRLRETKNGNTTCNSKLSVTRINGKRSDYIPLILWNNLAKEFDTFEIGTEKSVTGKLQSREYIKGDISHTIIEVNVIKINS